MKWMITISFLLVFAQAFKDFDQEGKKAYEAKDYALAIQKFEEAYRLEPKAKKYRVEGNFIDSYLPLYYLALCEEHRNLQKAEEWATKSRTAVEYEILNRDRDALAQYYQDLRRIEEAAEKLRNEKKVAFNNAMEKAKSFLMKNQFKQARDAYQKLAAENPANSEILSAIRDVDFSENRYLDSRKEILEAYLSGGQIEEAEKALLSLKQTFPERDFSAMETRLTIAREARKDQVEPIAIADSKPKQVIQKERPIPHEEVIQKEKPKTTVENSTLLKSQARQQLVNVLGYFRRSGDAEQALTKLETVEIKGFKNYPSYHWVRALLLAYQGEKDGDGKAFELSKNEINAVIKMGGAPKIQKELYPEFFNTLVSEVMGAQP